MLNYSKWDKLDVSDDEEESSNSKGGFMISPNELIAGMGSIPHNEEGMCSNPNCPANHKEEHTKALLEKLNSGAGGSSFFASASNDFGLLGMLAVPINGSGNGGHGNGNAAPSAGPMFSSTSGAFNTPNSAANGSGSASKTTKQKPHSSNIISSSPTTTSVVAWKWDVPPPLPGMIQRQPQLPASYIGSPNQRMQYSEAWRVHRKYFETHTDLVFNPKIQVHIKDKISEIHPLFFTDPFAFKPKRNKHGVFLEWGIQDVYDEFMAFNVRKMSMHLLYGNNSPDFSDPIEFVPAVQFINALAYQKELQIFKDRALAHSQFLKAATTTSKNSQPPKPTQPLDYVIDVGIRGVTPRIWRRIKVSGGLSLSILHDKVLSPAMGWLRNYHAYVFTDQKDGSMFGPCCSNAIDMMHLPSNGFVLMDDTKFKLNDLLKRKGDVLIYDYDLGDHFEHQITLVEVLDKSKSDGKVTILGGEMSPLPEDSVGSPGYKGCQGYQKLLDSWESLSGKKKSKLKATIREAMNYEGRPPFDPYLFDVASCQESVKRALMTRASVPSGSKIVGWPIAGREAPPSSVFKDDRPPGEDREPIPFLKESVSCHRDPKTETVCYNCGNPFGIHSCGGCKMVYYCNTKCQKEHWYRHQLKCKRQTAYRAKIFAKRDALKNALN